MDTLPAGHLNDESAQFACTMETHRQTPALPFLPGVDFRRKCPQHPHPRLPVWRRAVGGGHGPYVFTPIWGISWVTLVLCIFKIYLLSNIPGGKLLSLHLLGQILGVCLDGSILSTANICSSIIQVFQVFPIGTIHAQAYCF